MSSKASSPEGSRKAQGSRSMAPSRRAYILRRLMRRDPLRKAIASVQALVDQGEPVLKDAFENLLLEVHQTCAWHANDRAELLALAPASSQGK